LSHLGAEAALKELTFPSEPLEEELGAQVEAPADRI
jgi:hypothetical protein